MRMAKKGLYTFIFHRRGLVKDVSSVSGFGDPSLYHALVVIFLEFFAWGLLTVPIINVLSETFPTNKFLMNGLILGVKGILSFLSAPLIGALSDIWGRKFFLLVTVFCTCMPIPLLRISPWWYFALCSISGVFSVTFSVVLAYVADITDRDERNAAYGLVSATFGASLVISPALGAYISESYSDSAAIALATAVAAFDVFFIMVAVPESLPSKLRVSWDRMAWENADPFASLRMVGNDNMVVSLCLIVFLSYLPEAGQFSCFFVYLKLVVGFTPEAVAAFIGFTGILSVIAQTGVLMVLQRAFGAKQTIIIGLLFQFLQLLWYGFGTNFWLMWAAGILVAASQITYPSISAFVSVYTDKDKQGTVQGIVTGIRGLCQGLGPAVFGFIFYLFHVDLNNAQDEQSLHSPFRKLTRSPFFGPPPQLAPMMPAATFRPIVAGKAAAAVIAAAVGGNASVAVPAAAVAEAMPTLETFAIEFLNRRLIPGPPFVFGAVLVAMAIFGALAWLPGHGCGWHHSPFSSSSSGVARFTRPAASWPFDDDDENENGDACGGRQYAYELLSPSPTSASVRTTSQQYQRSSGSVESGRPSMLAFLPSPTVAEKAITPATDTASAQLTSQPHYARLRNCESMSGSV